MSKIQFKKTNYAGITKKVVDNKIYGYRVMYELGRIQKYDPKTESYKTVQKKSTKMCDTLEEAIDFKLKMDKKIKKLKFLTMMHHLIIYTILNELKKSSICYSLIFCCWYCHKSISWLF